MLKFPSKPDSPPGVDAPKKPSEPTVMRWLASRPRRKAALLLVHSWVVGEEGGEGCRCVGGATHHHPTTTV